MKGKGTEHIFFEKQNCFSLWKIMTKKKKNWAFQEYFFSTWNRETREEGSKNMAIIECHQSYLRCVTFFVWTENKGTRGKRVLSWECNFVCILIALTVQPSSIALFFLVFCFSVIFFFWLLPIVFSLFSLFSSSFFLACFLFKHKIILRDKEEYEEKGRIPGEKRKKESWITLRWAGEREGE